MKNEWLVFLKDKINEEIENVLKLTMIDNHIQGTNFDINTLITFINLNMDKEYFIKKVVPKDSLYIIEGNPESLVIILNDTMGISTEITLLENNLAINKWIIAKYEEYCNIQDIKTTRIEINNFFKYQNCNLVAVGSQAFVNEVKQGNNVPLFSFIDE